MGQCVICGLDTDQKLFNQKQWRGDYVCTNFAPLSLDCKNVWRYRKKHGLTYHDYRSYIASDEWQLKANHAKRLANFECEQCGRAIPNSERFGDLDAHHNNYNNLYQETKQDIDVLCRSCHEKIHGL